MLGPALQTLRRARGLKQREVEATARLSSRTLTHYENGRKMPELATLGKILDALGATPLDLVREMEAAERAAERAAARSAPTPERQPEPPPGSSMSGVDAFDLLALLRDVIDQTLARAEGEVLAPTTEARGHRRSA